MATLQADGTVDQFADDVGLPDVPRGLGQHVRQRLDAQAFRGFLIQDIRA